MSTTALKNMKVPQFMPFIGEDEYKAIQPCFESNWITEGPAAEEFNRELLKLTGSKYGVFAPNGTLALYLALKSIGIGEGDEVLVPNFTFIGSANAVYMTGAIPVFVDVNRSNFQIDLSDADALINARIKAVMPVHIYGTSADMDAVMVFATRHNLAVVEDAAQAIGVHHKGKHAGTIGNVGAFSFFADKTITTGEGGYIVTNDEAIYNKLLYLRNQGRKNRGSFIHEEIGYNFRMTDIQCAIGLSQLSKLEEIRRKKMYIKALYTELLKDIPQVTFFRPEEDAEWLPFRIAILADNAHALMDFMKGHGIESRTFFYPLHLQPCFSGVLKHTGAAHNDRFANSVYGYEHGVCLPTFPGLSDLQIMYTCEKIKDFYAKK